MNTETTSNPTLRPYGPGKFNLMIDAAVYAASLEVATQVESLWDDTNFVCVFAPLYSPSDDAAKDLTPEEITFLSSQAGAILWENSQGQVEIHYYDLRPDLEAAWAGIQRAVNEGNYGL